MKAAPPHIFVDETWIEIEGKKHIMLGAISTENPGHLAHEVSRLKSSIGLKPFDEIKWNSANFNQGQRNRLSEGIIRLIRDCTGLISIVEGSDRQKASELFADQVIDYCSANEFPAYFLALDHGLIPKPDKLAEFVSRSHAPTCIGLSTLDSRYDQVIQCADVFVGFFRAAIRQELGAALKLIPNTDESFEDIRIAWTLTEYVILGTRGMLWGQTDTLDDRGFVYYEHPMHRAMGLGFRLHSTITQEVRNLLEKNIATVYMGCLH